jgi:hypothetical protein
MVYCIVYTYRQHYQCIGFHIKDGSKDRDSRIHVGKRYTFFIIEADIVSFSDIIILEKTEIKQDNRTVTVQRLYRS